MALKFVYKKRQNTVLPTRHYPKSDSKVAEQKPIEGVDYMAVAPQNNEVINEDIKVMDTKEKVEMVNKILESESQVKVKKLRKEKGLIERADNSIIITEENKELLHD